MKQEIWKEYKTTENFRWGTIKWEVSNYGNVKMNGKLYECIVNNWGYKRLFDGMYLHKVVAKLFIPNPDNKPQVDHIDTDKLNNHVDNLRWVTRKENNNNTLTIQHYSEASEGNKNAGKKHFYNGIEFISIKDAYDYAVKYDGYDKSYRTFCRHI